MLPMIITPQGDWFVANPDEPDHDWPVLAWMLDVDLDPPFQAVVADPERGVRYMTGRYWSPMP